MLANFTAEVFSAFVYGVASIIGGGILFESGRQYVKTTGSNLFRGKVEALPFFFGVLVMGWVLNHFESIVDGIVYSIPPLARFGIMITGAMLMFNYSVDRFNYTDPKSVSVYAMGVLIIVLSGT